MDPRTPEKFDELRIYDEGMIRVFTNVLESKQIPTVIATSSRAHSDAKQRIGVLRSFSRVSVPVAALIRTDQPPQSESRGFGAPRMRVNYLDESKSYAMYGRSPQPINLSYTYTAIVADMQQSNALCGQLWGKFYQNKSGMYARIPEWSPNGDGMFFPITLNSGVSSTGENDPQTDDRVFEVSVQLTLHAFNFDKDLVVKPLLTQVSSKFEFVTEIEG